MRARHALNFLVASGPPQLPELSTRVFDDFSLTPLLFDSEWSNKSHEFTF